MNDAAFRSVLDLYMVADPWPLSEADDETIRSFLNSEAESRGYDDWVQAYHDFEADQ